MAATTKTSVSVALRGRIETRVWLQGLVVETRGRDVFVLDDATGLAVVSVDLACPGSQTAATAKKGSYVMVLGVITPAPATADPHGPVGTAENEFLHVTGHQVIDLSSEPLRETMWFVELAYAAAGGLKASQEGDMEGQVY